MAEVQQDVFGSSGMDGPQSQDSSNGLSRTLGQYLAKNSPTFVRLEAARKKGWENPEGDIYWQNRRQQSDTATEDVAKAFYNMTKQIAEEMQLKTKALTPEGLQAQPLQSLDICMAPGGFTWGTLKYNRDAIAYGITLSPKTGGYKNWVTLPADRVKFMDVTMLANEFGVDTIPKIHPDHSLFVTERPFLDKHFQIIFCGGAVLRNHERSEHRKGFERTRLTTSQLILAMQRIIQGGTMVVLLRRPDTWDVIHLLLQFDSFSDIQLFKPYQKHAVRSTFYLVAKNVQPEAKTAKTALENWKKIWYRTTFGGDEGTRDIYPDLDVEPVNIALDEFGPRIIKLATPVWKIQADALEKQEKAWSGDRKRQQYGTKNIQYAVEKDYEAKGELQLHRISTATPFTCGRCNKKKKAKLVATYDNQWNTMYCNGCYGKLLSDN